MLLQEEAQTEALQLATKRAAASLRLEDEPPPAKHVSAAPSGAAAPPAAQKHEPPPVSAAARVGSAKAAAKASAEAQPSAPPTRAAAKLAEAAQDTAAPAAPAVPARSPTPAAAPTAARAPAAPSSALDAFFRGAGLSAQKIDDRQAEQTLHRLGQLMREMILGLNENLHVRAEQKNVLRIPNTTIQPQNNNPLKFSASVDEALNNLLFRESSEYLDAVEAVREAFTDVKQHQQTVLSAMRVAISDYIGRLDPDELENKFTSGKRGGLMSAANKLKYWDLYRDLYQVVTQSQPGQFPQQFLEEMARAYENEGARTGGTLARKPQAKVG